MNKDRFECSNQRVIDRLPWFVAVLRGHIEEEYINEYINFPPSVKKLEVVTNEETIGKYMYSFMEQHSLPRNKKEKKLTQLLSTHEQFMSFGMYELWGLIGDRHFVVDEIQTIILFIKHMHIGKFVNELFNKRVTAKTTGENALCKQILNASYGSDLQNNENFANVKFMSKEKALHAAVNASFISSLKVHNDLYLVEKESLSAT
jgi:hypothetical protein